MPDYTGGVETWLYVGIPHISRDTANSLKVAYFEGMLFTDDFGNKNIKGLFSGLIFDEDFKMHRFTSHPDNRCTRDRLMEDHPQPYFSQTGRQIDESFSLTYPGPSIQHRSAVIQEARPDRFPALILGPESATYDHRCEVEIRLRFLPGMVSWPSGNER